VGWYPTHIKIIITHKLAIRIAGQMNNDKKSGLPKKKVDESDMRSHKGRPPPRIEP
jgi:hypothetical protein